MRFMYVILTEGPRGPAIDSTGHVDCRDREEALTWASGVRLGAHMFGGSATVCFAFNCNDWPARAREMIQNEFKKL